jgi:hypothetical protein
VFKNQQSCCASDVVFMVSSKEYVYNERVTGASLNSIGPWQNAIRRLTGASGTPDTLSQPVAAILERERLTTRSAVNVGNGAMLPANVVSRDRATGSR